jgi:hypothetical protein
VQPGHDAGRVTEEELPGLGRRGAPRAARPFDQALADHALERGDLLADGGLGVAQPFSRPSKRAFLGDRLERRQVAELDAEPSIRSHDRDQF